MTKPVASFDHLTRASQQSWLQFHAESFCGFEIEDLSAAMAEKISARRMSKATISRSTHTRRSLARRAALSRGLERQNTAVPRMRLCRARTKGYS
jgi:hypothetical protein